MELHTLLVSKTQPITHSSSISMSLSMVAHVSIQTSLLKSQLQTTVFWIIKDLDVELLVVMIKPPNLLNNNLWVLSCSPTISLNSDLELLWTNTELLLNQELVMLCFMVDIKSRPSVLRNVESLDMVLRLLICLLPMIRLMEEWDLLLFGAWLLDLSCLFVLLMLSLRRIRLDKDSSFSYLSYA